jgi:hypothetical protein
LERRIFLATAEHAEMAPAAAKPAQMLIAGAAAALTR